MSRVNAPSVLCLVYDVACNWISVRGFMVNGKVLWGIKFDFVPRFDNPPCLCLIYIPKYSAVDNLSCSYSVYCNVVYKHAPC